MWWVYLLSRDFAGAVCCDPAAVEKTCVKQAICLFFPAHPVMYFLACGDAHVGVYLKYFCCGEDGIPGFLALVF